MENADTSSDNVASTGNVYVMTHSFFSDVIKIGCTRSDPVLYAEELSAKSPGNYTLVFALECKNPCQIQKQIKDYLNAQEYTSEFYQVSTETAKGLLRREVMRIPALNA
jgi:hypothetical protein